MSSNNILKIGRNCKGIYKVDRSSVIIDAEEYFKKFYELASQAENYILLSGWEFHSELALLKGSDRESALLPYKLLPFLNQLCINNPNLKVYILSWKPNIVFWLSREWVQRFVFYIKAHKNVHFSYDYAHPIGASIHHKSVVIDGREAFLGSSDLANHHWDKKGHPYFLASRRNSSGEKYTPQHEVQSYVSGEIVGELANHFQERWLQTNHKQLNLSNREGALPDREIGIRLNIPEVALSRTQPNILFSKQQQIHEIKFLFEDMIMKARNYIYFENQYFVAINVFESLIARMENQALPKLEIIIINPKQEHNLIDSITYAKGRNNIYRRLRLIAEKYGHSLGIYYPVTYEKSEKFMPVYVHSKLVIVDDKFITIGSANIAQRSMGLDTELNLAWETLIPDESIRFILLLLLEEHSGIDKEQLFRLERYVSFLDECTEKHNSKLKKYPINEKLIDDNGYIKDMILDADRPVYEIIRDKIKSKFWFWK